MKIIYNRGLRNECELMNTTYLISSSKFFFRRYFHHCLSIVHYRGDRFYSH